MFILVGYCQRRIVKGARTHGQKRYMVYLVKSRESTDVFDSWLCGGALVTTSQILTSAACIVDIDNIYAIAGYRKYVNGLDIDRDNCTKIKKKRIVKIRVPREHVEHLKEYTSTTKWMTLDIGVATVDQPYDFNDVSYRIYCSYMPAAIEINYNPNLELKMGTNVVALGWGRDRGTKTTDVVDRNSEMLREVSMKIKHKGHCIDNFKGNGLSEIIEKYMICTHGKGLLDGEGFVIENLDEKFDKKCIDSPKGVLNVDTDDDNECIDDLDDYEFRRRTVLNKTIEKKHQDYNKKINVTHGRLNERTRRQGICQNDHGGPLITWVGSTELLIGVAVNSLYDENFECVGPYLFTSTSAAGQIVRCLLASEQLTRRNCLAKDNAGFEIFEKFIDLSEYTTGFRANTHDELNITAKQIDTPVIPETEPLSSIEVVTL